MSNTTSARCPDLDTPDTLWSFCPNIGAAYTFTVSFALTTTFHLFQAIWYKKPYCWVIVISGLAQTLAYMFRIISILNPASLSDYAVWFVLILVAPLFTNAYVYMVMGRMVWNYIADARIYRVTAWRFGVYFVVLDVLALLVQIYGAATATGQNQPENKTLKALRIYMGGVGIQQCFILVFLVFAIQFHRTLLSQSAIYTASRKTQKQPFILLYVIYTVLVLISVRIIFRLCEYSQGLTSTIPNHEAFQYCLDSLPMLLALVLLNVIHPGRIMYGSECNIPSRKERKDLHLSKKSDMGNHQLEDLSV